MAKTKIEWAEHSWNPITGCSHAGSPGCDMCYARRMARRLAGRCGYPEAPHHFDVTLRPDRLDIPLRRKKPTMYFVCSMSDLFHEDVPFEFIDKIMAAMTLCPQHTFQVLTKRPERMLEYLCDYPSVCDGGNVEYELTSDPMFLWEAARQFDGTPERYCDIVGVDETQASPDYMVELDKLPIFPLPNLWLGVSVENQVTANERIPILLQTPAAVRFVSCEPLLAEIDIEKYLQQWQCPNCLTWQHTSTFCDYCETEQWENIDTAAKRGISWTIVGGESGPGARPMHPDWARSLRDQCQAADVPFFFKQWGAWHKGARLDTNTWAVYTKAKRWQHTSSYNEALQDKKAGYITMARVGKKCAGRLLDGREHNELPSIP